MAVPYTFATIPNGNAIPLSYLDANFTYLTTSPTFSGNVTITGTLGVGNAVTFGSTLDVSGNTTVGGTLGVTSNATVGGTLGVTSNATVGGTLGVTSNATVGGTLGVTGAATLGSSGSAQGVLNFSGATSGLVTVQGAAAAGTWTFTLPTNGGTNGYILTTNGSGTSTWTNPTALGIDLDVGSTAITGGASDKILYDNAGVLGEKSVTGTGDVVLNSAPTIDTPSVTTKLNINGSSSGVISIQGAAAAGTWSLTLPTTAGTNKYALTTDGSGVGSWSQIDLAAAVTGVLPVANGGTNASSAGITAFNNITGYTASGATGTTSTNLVFSTAPTLTGLSLAAGTVSVAPLTLTSGTNLTSPVAGSIEYDGSNIYSTITAATGRGYVQSTRRFTLFSAGSAITTIANYFGANSNIPLTANSTYDIEIVLYYAKSGTGGTVVWTLTNSASPTSMNVHYEMSPITGVVAPPGTATLLVGETLNSTSASYTVTTGSITASTSQYARFKIFLQNGAGTSLQIQATSNGSAITPGNGSFWTCTRVPSSNTGTYAA